MQTTSAGYWVNIYHVMHLKYAAEHMHHASYLQHTSWPSNRHLCFALPKLKITITLVSP